MDIFNVLAIGATGGCLFMGTLGLAVACTAYRKHPSRQPGALFLAMLGFGAAFVIAGLSGIAPYHLDVSIKLN